METAPQPFTQAAGHSGVLAGLQAGCWGGGSSVHSGTLALALGSDRKGRLRPLLEWDRGVRLFLWHGQFLE